ncbi:MAG: sulfur carrier protein ThiS [Candidatus Thermoplasmatota archaeon]|nr:sulfur carrier protein ThiS [Candidatus Thermoplasmatota archaeon]
MTITVNGRKVEYRQGESVNRLLKRMRYNFPLVIVKVNGTIVNREDHIRTEIDDGDEIQVIHLTSGG